MHASPPWVIDHKHPTGTRHTPFASGKATNTGKPQGVLIADAQSMAAVPGEDLSHLLAVAKEKARKS